MFEAKLVPKASSPINSEEISSTTEEITRLPPSTTDVLLSYVNRQKQIIYARGLSVMQF